MKRGFAFIAARATVSDTGIVSGPVTDFDYFIAELCLKVMSDIVIVSLLIAYVNPVRAFTI